MQRRTDLARVDDEEKRRKVNKARNYIYNKNLAISSKQVEKELKDTSLTPTDVCSRFQCDFRSESALKLKKKL